MRDSCLTFFPGVVLILARLARPSTCMDVVAGRDRRSVTLAASIVVMLALTPYTWNGGGGPPGNRYVLSLYPVLFFLLPAPVSGVLAGVSLLGLAVTAPLLARPMTASCNEKWLNVEHGIPRVLPIELTLPDDLPVRLNPLRSRLDLDGALLYLMDGNAFLPGEDQALLGRKGNAARGDDPAH